MNELDLMRGQMKSGMHPREVLIESYRREWLSDPWTARGRLAKWDGTTTGDAIREGARRAGVRLPSSGESGGETER